MVESRVRIWIDKATKKAAEMVEANWQQIDTLANILIRQEIVDGGELEKIVQKKRGAEGGRRLGDWPCGGNNYYGKFPSFP